MAERVNEFEVVVRFSEIDSMHIAHNSCYYVWFEDARFDFSERVLHFDRATLNTEVLLPVVTSQCRYLRAIRFGDALTIRTWLYVPPEARITFYYEVFDPRGRLLALGKTTHALVRRDGRLLVRFPEIVTTAFARGCGESPECFLSAERRVELERALNKEVLGALAG